jgi:hypothetical protein
LAIGLVAAFTGSTGLACGLGRTGLAEVADDGGSPLEVDAGVDADPVSSDGASAEDQSSVDAAMDTGTAANDSAADTAAPTCAACAVNTCCNSGKCSPIGDHACADPGQDCVDCASAATGNKCIALAGHQVCGCAGPANKEQCPANMACHNQQCGVACDGQHPCNGGCCSGNDLATSVCVVACASGTACMGNYCQ